jgi:hypothetical protein
MNQTLKTIIGSTLAVLIIFLHTHVHHHEQYLLKLQKKVQEHHASQ